MLANSLAPLIVRLTFVFASAILAEAVLSFLGVGPPPPAPSFGNIIAGGRDFVEEARTLLVSRSGATIVLSRVLGPDKTIYIKCGATQKESEARVVGPLGIQLNCHIYGAAAAATAARRRPPDSSSPAAPA